MKRAGIAWLVLVAGCAHAVAPTAGPPPCEGPPPSLAAIQPVLERRCFSCHAAGGEAAEDHDFSRVRTLLSQRRTIGDQVSARAMPPPGRPPLTDDEASSLVRWASCDGSAE